MLEERDRHSDALARLWGLFWERSHQDGPLPAFEPALDDLVASGLVHLELSDDLHTARWGHDHHR